MEVLTQCSRQYSGLDKSKVQPLNSSPKSNLESDYLIVQVIYEYCRAKGISYIVMGEGDWA